jgi:hypothetical protein
MVKIRLKPKKIDDIGPALLFNTHDDLKGWMTTRREYVSGKMSAPIVHSPDMFDRIYTMDKLIAMGTELEYAIVKYNTPRDYVYTKMNSQGSLISQTFPYTAWAVHMKFYEVVK